MHLATEYPKSRALLISRQNLSSASKIIILIATRMKQDSNLEQAVYFAARTIKGGLSSELESALSDALNGKTPLKQGIMNLAQRYRHLSRGFFDSVQLIVSSTSETNEKTRKSVLDSSIKCILSCEEKEFSGFLGSLAFPTIILLSIGTSVPLAVLSLAPVSSVFNLKFASPENLAVFLGFSLFGIYFFEKSVLKKMPFVFSGAVIAPQKVNYFLVSALFLFFLIPSVYIHEYAVVFAVAVSLAFYSFQVSEKGIQESLKIKQFEHDTVYFSQHISGLLISGKSPESALNEAVESAKGSEIETPLKKSVLNLKNGMSLSDSFFHETEGALKNIGSDIVRVVFLMFSETAKKGNVAAGRTMQIICKALYSMNEAEQKLKKNLEHGLGMMKNTAVFFAPVMCGLVVTMQKLMLKSFSGFNTGFFDFSPSAGTGFLGLITGIYCLVLTVLIIYYVSFIESNNDRNVFFHNIYKKLPATAVLFIISAVLSSYLLL